MWSGVFKLSENGGQHVTSSKTVLIKVRQYRRAAQSDWNLYWKLPGPKWKLKFPATQEAVTQCNHA